MSDNPSPLPGEGGGGGGGEGKTSLAHPADVKSPTHIAMANRVGTSMADESSRGGG
jgi:hypothetical protein